MNKYDKTIIALADLLKYVGSIKADAGTIVIFGSLSLKLFDAVSEKHSDFGLFIGIVIFFAGIAEMFLGNVLSVISRTAIFRGSSKDKLFESDESYQNKIVANLTRKEMIKFEIAFLELTSGLVDAYYVKQLADIREERAELAKARNALRKRQTSAKRPKLKLVKS